MKICVYSAPYVSKAQDRLGYAINSCNIAGEYFWLCCEGFAGIIVFNSITDIIGFTVDIIG